MFVLAAWISFLIRHVSVFFLSFLQPNINANARKQVGLTDKKILNESGAPTDRFAREIRSAGIFEKEKAANNILGIRFVSLNTVSRNL